MTQKFNFALALAFLSFSAMLNASVSWPYTGYLDDNTGNPYTGNVLMKFALIRSTDGAQVWNHDGSSGAYSASKISLDTSRVPL